MRPDGYPDAGAMWAALHAVRAGADFIRERLGEDMEIFWRVSSADWQRLGVTVAPPFGPIVRYEQGRWTLFGERVKVVDNPDDQPFPDMVVRIVRRVP